MIRRVLIANRGEIAVRIARAAREAGIEPLGIYSDADRAAYHLDFMARSARVGPAAAPESYLNIPSIIEAARELDADAVHPGYGFLSERAAFAQAALDAGLTFIGPSPAAIAAMGDKARAKRRVREFDVPTLPGYDGDEQDVELLRARAGEIGVPLLIKASAGGGGRGMRVVRDLAHFDELLTAAKREALAAFGDDRMILERYLTAPRHIEFQVFGDRHGTIVHMGERECSIQRRHQKIIEEAPSCALDEQLRAAMGAAAVRAARSVEYTNAGTVEFLLDRDDRFYFLEMNTRIQVEHPVTELAYGVDIVRLQFDIANGAALSPAPAPAQESVQPRGWAIEARLYAEDPARGMLPSAGTISRFELPAGPGIRIDSGVRSGSDVSLHYDPMLAKIIAFGTSREHAIARLRDCLAQSHVSGVRTNLPLLSWIIEQDEFTRGEFTTHYLDERFDPKLFAPREPSEIILAAAAAVAIARGAWRIGGIGIPVAFASGDREYRIVASRGGGSDIHGGAADGNWILSGSVDGEYDFGVGVDAGIVRVRNAELSLEAKFEAGERGIAIEHRGIRYELSFAPPPSAIASTASTHAEGSGRIDAPMPGRVLKIAVSPGDTVAAHDLLLILEAMKMEHRIEAPHGGTVRAVHVRPDQLVGAGANLIEMI